MTTNEPWGVGVDLSRFRDHDQNTTQTTDGQPSEDAPNLCGQAQCSNALFYLTGVEKLPDEVHDEGKEAGWGQGYVGLSDWPQIAQYMRDWNGISCSVHHPGSPQDLSRLLWGQLWNHKYAIYLVTYGANPHWVGALQMNGGSSSNPFDTILRSNTWGGIREAQSWSTWFASLRRYVDGALLALTFDRLPATLAVDTHLGP